MSSKFRSYLTKILREFSSKHRKTRTPWINLLTGLKFKVKKNSWNKFWVKITNIWWCDSLVIILTSWQSYWTFFRYVRTHALLCLFDLSIRKSPHAKTNSAFFIGGCSRNYPGVLYFQSVFFQIPKFLCPYKMTLRTDQRSVYVRELS